MNKSELIDKVSKTVNITKTEAGEVLDSIIENIKETLKDGGKLAIIGFGTFSVSQRKARKGRNPKTGEPIHIPASKTPKFTSSEVLKKAINK